MKHHLKEFSMSRGEDKGKHVPVHTAHPVAHEKVPASHVSAAAEKENAVASFIAEHAAYKEFKHAVMREFHEDRRRRLLADNLDEHYEALEANALGADISSSLQNPGLFERGGEEPRADHANLSSPQTPQSAGNNTLKKSTALG